MAGSARSWRPRAGPIDRLTAAGAGGYLTKPIAVSDFLRLLETYEADT